MKKVISLFLCLAMVLTTFTDSFAYANNISNGLSYDPEQLMDLLPQSATGSSIPDPYRALTPQLPYMPDTNNAQTIAGPARNEINAPKIHNEAESPVDIA